MGGYIKINFEEMGREGVAYINLFQDIVWWWVGRA
jgi:hypothetical protein